MRISDWSSDVCSSDLVDVVNVRYAFGPPKSFDDLVKLHVIRHGAHQQLDGFREQRETLIEHIGGDQDRHDEVGDVELVEQDRSEERSVGKERVSTWRSRWSSYHEKKKKTTTNN